MKKAKTFIITAAALGIMTTGALTAKGLTLQHIDMGTSWGSVYIQGYNAVGEKGTGLYGTDTKKVVTGCNVRLREGSYDKSANNYQQKGGWTDKLSKVNNPLDTAYTTYSWRY